MIWLRHERRTERMQYECDVSMNVNVASIENDNLRVLGINMNMQKIRGSHTSII